MNSGCQIKLVDQEISTRSPFPKDQWYIIALSKELQDNLLGRKILNIPMVIFRDKKGKAVALEDRCCHRGMPLSQGLLEQGKIRCSYHGLLYDENGQCIEVPGQNRIPSKAKIKSFYLEEKQGLIWLWYGKEESVPLIEAPDYPYHDDPDYLYDGDRYHYQAPYQLIHDNLMDLSHLAYVHLKTIGGNAKAHMNATMKTKVIGNQVIVTRHMLESDPPPTYSMAYPFKNKIDRWQEIDFRVSHIRIWTGAIEAGDDSLENPDRKGFHMRGFHAITPETENSCHYFWTMSTNPKHDREHIAKLVIDQTKQTFDEDKEVIENQYKNLDDFNHPEMIGIHIDVGLTHARRIIQSLI